MSRQLPALAMSCALAALLPGALGGAQDPAGRRIALVIGNDRYSGPMVLQNARRDATAVAAELRGLGFQTTLVQDATRPQFDDALERFAGSLSAADIALFYYAGHGVQVKNENYLIPVDYTGSSEDGVVLRGVGATKIQTMIARARVSIVVLDACRNNPYAGTRSGGGGLAPPIEAVGTLVAFATGAGQVASDNPGGTQGTFTGALLEALRVPGLSIQDIFKRTRQQVYTVTNGRQWPALYDNLIGEVVLRPLTPGEVTPPPPTAKPVVNAPPAPPARGRGAGPVAPPPSVTPSPAPAWLVGDFRGINPVTKSNVEITVHADGTIAGFVDAGGPRPTPVQYVWIAATNQIVDPTGAYVFDVERTENAFRTRQVGAAANTITYRRVYLPPTPPAAAGSRALAPDAVRRATPDELATMIAVINEWMPAWVQADEAAGRVVYPAWSTQAIRADREKRRVEKVTAQVTCNVANVRRDQASVRCAISGVEEYKASLVSMSGRAVNTGGRQAPRKFSDNWMFHLFWNGTAWLIENITT